VVQKGGRGQGEVGHVRVRKRRGLGRRGSHKKTGMVGRGARRPREKLHGGDLEGNAARRASTDGTCRNLSGAWKEMRKKKTGEEQ